MDTITYRYNTLEDFLASKMLTVDGTLDDGWGANVAVKGREIDATIFFCDIAAFSARTKDLTPTETLIFANHFFTWMTAEAIRNTHGIIDKYIGDEVMIVFSREFGSQDPFAEAIQVAARMYRFDAFSYCPHIGIASGRVIVGHVGTAIRYNCSVFGLPVALAARCAGIKPPPEPSKIYGGWVTFPASEWSGRDIDTVCPPLERKNEKGEVVMRDQSFTVGEPLTVPIKNLPDLEVRQLIYNGFHLPNFTPEGWAQRGAMVLLNANRMWPDVNPAKS